MNHPPIPQVPGILVPRFCGQCAQPLERRSLKTNEPDRLVCGGCGAIHWLDPKVAVGTLLVWEGGLVLAQRAIDPGYGKWIFPGGFVDRGETVRDAARREAREEVSVEVGDLELLNVYSYAGHPVILITFIGEITGGSPAAADETLAVRSFAFDQIPYDELAFRSTAEAIHEFVARRRAGGRNSE